MKKVLTLLLALAMLLSLSVTAFAAEESENVITSTGAAEAQAWMSYDTSLNERLKTATPEDYGKLNDQSFFIAKFPKSEWKNCTEGNKFYVKFSTTSETAISGYVGQYASGLSGGNNAKNYGQKWFPVLVHPSSVYSNVSISNNEPWQKGVGLFAPTGFTDEGYFAVGFALMDTITADTTVTITLIDYNGTTELGTRSYTFKKGEVKEVSKEVTAIAVTGQGSFVNSIDNALPVADMQLTATLTGGTGDVTWGSSNTNVATVNESGKVSFVGVGTATITASIGEVKGTYEVTIYPEKVTVTYGENGGSAVAAQTVTGGVPATKPDDPTREGYTFDGWYAEGAGTAYDFSAKVTEDVKLSAKWTPNQYTITFDSNGGTDVASITANYGAEISAPANPTRDGYTFAGWSVETFPSTMPLNGAKYTASWNANDGTAYKVEHYQQNLDGDDYTLADTDNRTGTTAAQTEAVAKTYEGFTAQSFEQAAIAANGSTTVRINYTRNSYTVTFNANGGSTVTPVTANYGTSVPAPTAPTRSGYNFAGWTDAGGNAVSFPVTVGGDVTYTAQWNAITYYYPPATTNTTTIDDPDVPLSDGNDLEEIDDGEVPLADLPLLFADVSTGDWYRDPVAYVYSKGLMTGYSTATFAPGENTTRAQIATILMRLDDGTAPEEAVTFSDVTSGAWYADGVAWAAENGLMSGYGNGVFGAADNITREQLVTVLYRYATSKGYDVSGSADLSAFSDAKNVSGYAQAAMAWAVDVGIIEGYDGKINPIGTATRAEIAAILMRFCEGVAKNSASNGETEIV